MQIIINDRRKIFTIQQEFNIAFPYLKLEFHSKPSIQGGSPLIKFVQHNTKTLREYRTIHNKEQIKITHYMTVTDLEQMFRDIYGLVIQVFRKSGKIWLEISVTNGWTLEEQNSQGEELSKINS